MPEEVSLDPAARDDIYAAMLKQHPNDFIGAVSPMGLFMPLPDGLDTGGLRHIVGAQSALGLVVADDHKMTIEAWQRALGQGVANCLVHPVAAPTELVRLHLLDMTHRHGVFVVFLTGLSAHPAGSTLQHDPIKPRLVTVHKDQVAVITSADPEISLVLGWTDTELAGTRSLDLVHPDDQQRAIASWMDMLSSPQGEARRVRLRHLHRDGHPIWFEVTNYNLLADPDRPRVVAEMLDISDEMAAQEALRTGEKLMRRLTETIPMGIVQIDAGRRIVYQNARAARAIGAGLGDILGDAYLGPIVPGDRPAIDDALAGVLGAGTDIDVEYGHRDERGLRRVRASLRSLTGESGEITGAIVCLTDVTEDVRLRDELKQRASYDALTGCRNRATTLHALGEALAGPGRTSGTAVVFIDLNDFKQVNDRYGHAAGDALLTHVAGRLRAAVRDGDVVGRFGGDEFVVICADVATAERARRIGETLLTALGESCLEVAGERLLPQASIGVAWGDPATSAPDALIARADTAMYAAKKARTGRLALVLAQ
ncbi:diguanylate cyclase domain-containing protein [Actinoplanes sp. NPDC049599]|uniref:diguanylate cyclase domain-containing protein n=1 Tax=Actinoplanes sp. NPDC049599 TaxID=3363903 RepID=UPI0037AC985F